MEKNEKDYRVFQAIKYWTDLQLSNQKCYLDESYFYEKCKHPDLSDARCLFRMILMMEMMIYRFSVAQMAHNEQGLCVRAGVIRLNFDHERLARLTQNPSYSQYFIIN